MTSRAILVRDAIIDLLNDDRPSDVPAATKRRAFPGEPLRDSTIAVFLGAEPARYPGNVRSAVVARRRTVVVQIGVIAEDEASIDDLTEDLRSWVVSVLGDTALGGLALSVEDRGVLEQPLVWKAEYVYALTHVGFDVEFQTARADLGSAH